jgi:hypothetical protein
LNAISFAMNGNIALSMEIGSAYALQVMLLQVPALVLYSGVWAQWMEPGDVAAHTFNLIFPQWDMVTIVLSVFLMGWVIGEGKSNYFKGSILILAYLTIIIGFWFSSWSSDTVCVFLLSVIVLICLFANTVLGWHQQPHGYQPLRHTRPTDRHPDFQHHWQVHARTGFRVKKSLLPCLTPYYCNNV